MLSCVTKRISAAKAVEKEVIKLVYKADNKKRSSTKIGLGGEGRVPRKTLSGEMKRFYRSVVSSKRDDGAKAEEWGWGRGRVAVIVIIFSGGRIYATHLVVPVHKTHLKFSRQAGKVAAVLVDEAEGGGGGCGAPRGL